MIILRTLRVINKKHFTNSLYTVQWYFMLKNLIMEGATFMELRFDLLINELF